MCAILISKALEYGTC